MRRPTAAGACLPVRYHVPTDNIWIQFLVNVLAGAIAGGVTNAIAVWMLFHPYEPRAGLHGAIPKNKARLARSIGRTVGERLLTPADVTAELSRSGFRQAFDAKIEEVVHGLLETERGALRELMPSAVFEEVERALAGVGDSAGDAFSRYVEGEEFEAQTRRFVARAREELATRPVGQLLTAERRDRLTTRASEWAAELAGSDEIELGVREYLERNLGQLLASDAALLDKVPPALVETLERAIDAYLPLAVARLGEFLAQPSARERLRGALHDIFQRFVEDLRFHERVIAKLVVTERTFDKALASLERDGVEQVASLLEDPIVREEISRTIHAAVIAYLRKPISEIVGTPGDPQRAATIVTAAGDYLLRVVRSDRTHDFLIGKLHDVLVRAEGRTWGELLSSLPDEMVTGWIRDAARAPRTRELVADTTRGALRNALERPIGRPGRWLPADTPARLTSTVAPALWEWLHAQVPALVQRMDIEQMVERKVLGFSTQRIEEIIRSVTQKELNLIVYLGYVLGAMIGIMTFGISRLFN